MVDDSDDDFDDYEIEEEIITTADSLDEETEEDVTEQETEEDDSEPQPEPSTRKRKIKSRKRKNIIKWKKGEFHPVVHDFDDTNSGFRADFCSITPESSILEYFECFVTPEMTSKIAFETNR